MVDAEPSLVEKVILLDESLAAHGIRHAFGGALALAYHTFDPRATADIDVNISLDPSHAPRVFESLPRGIEWSPADTALRPSVPSNPDGPGPYCLNRVAVRD